MLGEHLSYVSHLKETESRRYSVALKTWCDYAQKINYYRARGSAPSNVDQCVLTFGKEDNCIGYLKLCKFICDALLKGIEFEKITRVSISSHSSSHDYGAWSTDANVSFTQHLRHLIVVCHYVFRKCGFHV